MQVGRLTESLPHSGAKSDEAPCGAILSSKTLQVFGTPPVFCPPSPASRHNSYYGRSAPTTTSKLQRHETIKTLNIQTTTLPLAVLAYAGQCDEMVLSGVLQR